MVKSNQTIIACLIYCRQIACLRASLFLQCLWDKPQENPNRKITDTPQGEAGVTQPEQIGEITNDNRAC